MTLPRTILVNLVVSALVAIGASTAAVSLERPATGPRGLPGSIGAPGPVGPAGSPGAAGAAAHTDDLGFCAAMNYQGTTYVANIGGVSKHPDGTAYCISGVWIPVTPGAGQAGQ